MQGAGSQHSTIPPYAAKQKKETENIKEKIKNVENAIKQIYNADAGTLSFQHLYTCGYSIVQQTSGDTLYTTVDAKINEHVNALKEEVLFSEDSVFLETLLCVWDKHKTAVNMVKDILMYMDKNYVPSTKNLHLYDLGVYIFGNVILKHQIISERMRGLVLSSVQQERQGEEAPKRFVPKSITKMLVEVSKREIYEAVLERYLLEDTANFYRSHTQILFESTTAPEYIRTVFHHLEDERSRVRRCFDESTLEKVENVLKREMIVSYSNRLLEKEGSGCKSMLRDWRVAELGLMYDAMALCGHVEQLIHHVKDHLVEQGLRFVTDSDNSSNPSVMIDGILELREKYSSLLKEAFSSIDQNNERKVDPLFESHINKAFEEIINKNQRLPEYLSLYVDSKVRKGKSQVRDEEMDSVFDKVLVVFKSIKDKDVFEKYYKTHLAKRLLGGTSTSEDIERVFITKLKMEYGYTFTSKLEGMFKDMKINEDTNAEFRKYYLGTQRKIPIELYVNTLTTNMWPVSKSDECNLPLDMAVAINLFKQFYTEKHNGRLIKNQNNMGNGELRMRVGVKNYEIIVSTYQTVILLHFNNSDSYTISQLSALTSISPGDLKRSLASLTHSTKVYDALLLKEGNEDDATITINKDFKCKLHKIKIQQLLQRETEVEAKEARVKVGEERKWHLEAAIVRVMKARKQEDHRNLVSEVIKIFEGKFSPSVDDIKKRIESLIDREYLGRIEGNRSRYYYLA